MQHPPQQTWREIWSRISIWFAPSWHNDLDSQSQSGDQAQSDPLGSTQPSPVTCIPSELSLASWWPLEEASSFPAALQITLEWLAPFSQCQLQVYQDLSPCAWGLIPPYSFAKSQELVQEQNCPMAAALPPRVAWKRSGMFPSQNSESSHRTAWLMVGANEVKICPVTLQHMMGVKASGSPTPQ